MPETKWTPPEHMSREELIAASDAVLARPDIATAETEHVFTVKALGLSWDVGVTIYEPVNHAQIPVGADGRKAGMFILHGGSGDFRSMERLNRLLAGKFGFKVVSMTYPGRLYLPDPSRNWPGDTVKEDGTVRTPIWHQDESVSPDEYDVLYDDSLRLRYGIRPVARAKEGTPFYDRMAAWPVAMEEAILKACATHLPDPAFSIYVHGHSTGGPFVHMASQRVANIAGVVGIENSPFGYMYRAMAKIDWPNPFNDLIIRTWRDIARYRGAEALSMEGDSALMRLAWLMEEVHDDWDAEKHEPQFKAEYPIHYAQKNVLEDAARAAAKRLHMNREETDALIARYIGYTQELTGPDVKPVPPILLSICKHSRDHTEQVYRDIVVPMYAAMDPAPKVGVTRFATGTHFYEKAEDGLPMGLIAPVAGIWFDAIENGYYVSN